MGMGENISDHANANWDAVLWYHISENEYATIKNSMDENPFGDKGYDWAKRNCVDWVIKVLEQSKNAGSMNDKIMNIDILKDKIFKLHNDKLGGQGILSSNTQQGHIPQILQEIIRSFLQNHPNYGRLH